MQFPRDAACQPLLTEKRGALLSPFPPPPGPVRAPCPPGGPGSDSTSTLASPLAARTRAAPTPSIRGHSHTDTGCLPPDLWPPHPASPAPRPTGQHLAEGPPAGSPQPPALALGQAPLRGWLTLGRASSSRHATCCGSWGPSSWVPEVLSLATDGHSGAASKWEGPFYDSRAE